MQERDTYSQLLVSGFVIEAIGAGFEIIDDSTGKPHTKSDEVWKIIKPHWKNVIKAAELERTFGSSIVVVFASENPNTKGQPFIKIFRHDAIKADSKLIYNDGTLKEITLLSKSFPDGKEVPHMFKLAGLDNVYQNIVRYKDQTWEGRSYLEPIWDELQGIRLIRMGATLYAIRVGAGLRIITVPKGTHKDVIEEMKLAAAKTESFNGFFIIPEEGAKVAIESGGGEVNYDALKSVLLESIAAYTHYPIAGFTGIEIERQGGDFNEEKVLDVWRYIQRAYEPLLRFLLARFDIHHKFGIPLDKITISWLGREEISDSNKVKLEILEADRDARLITAGIKSAQEIRDERGLEGDLPEPPQIGFRVDGLQDEEEDEEEEENDDE